MLKWKHSAILLTFIKLPFVTIIFVLAIFEWPLKTGFTVNVKLSIFNLKKASEYDQELPQSHTADNPQHCGEEPQFYCINP